jgi:VWFA-related protein
MRAARILLVVAMVLAALVARGSAQDAVFRSRIDLVTVDATVLGSDGRPVSTLDAADFVIRVDGQIRRVVTAEFVGESRPATRPTEPVPVRHFSTNQQADTGRFVVVAVDEAHIRRLEGRPAIRAAAAFIDSLDPMDRVAVTPLSRVGVTEFTRDRRALHRRLEAIRGQTDPLFLQFNIGLAEAVEIADGGRAMLRDVVIRECGRSLTEYNSAARAIDDVAGRDACPEQVEQEARATSQHARTLARISLSAIEALIANLKTIEGPKTVVLLSEGMVVDPRLVDVTDLAAAAKDARVTIYVLHMDVPMFEASQDRVSPSLMRDLSMLGDGLGRVAGATRGAVFRLVGSDSRPFEKIATEISGYYLLGFEAIDSDRDGRVHRVEVRLARGGGELRARSAFRMPVVAPSARSREEDLVSLLRSGAATELPVRIATYTYREPGSSRVRVVVSTEADGKEGGASQVLFGYVFTDTQGVIAASGAYQARLGRHTFSATVDEGPYTLRVGGIDPLGRRGLVERPLAAAVEVQAGLRLSDLILAPVPASPEAPLQPVVDRIRDRRLTAYLELYPDEARPLTNARVVFEVAAPSGAGRPVVQTTAVQRTSQFSSARAIVALTTLPAGRYVATARVMEGDYELARVTRPFSFEP